MLVFLKFSQGANGQNRAQARTDAPSKLQKKPQDLLYMLVETSLHTSAALMYD